MIHLVDTAGLGRPVDGLDELAMERSRRQREAADVCVWIEDGTSTAAAALVTSQGESDGADPDQFALRVATKMDLPGFRAPQGFLAVSNRTRAGLEEFRARLDALVFRKAGTGEDIVLTTERQFHAVAAARERVEVALAEMRTKPAIEIIAFEIREAAGHLKVLLGEISSDEVLQKVFSGYCIGK
jgi:tRNA modification GTPase